MQDDRLFLCSLSMKVSASRPVTIGNLEGVCGRTLAPTFRPFRRIREKVLA
jgi:hypothetical protein